MKATDKHSHAKPYAEALLELAQQGKQVDAIAVELNAIAELLEQNPSFAQLLADPAIGHNERAGILDRTFRGRFSDLMWNFLGVLNEKRRLELLTTIAETYDQLLDELYGKIEVDVTVVRALSQGELENVRAKVSGALGKDAVVHQYVDDSIIGGMVLRVKDQIIDASVKAQLEALRQRLLAAQPKH